MPQVPNSEHENNILSYGHFQVFVSEFSVETDIIFLL